MIEVHRVEREADVDWRSEKRRHSLGPGDRRQGTTPGAPSERDSWHEESTIALEIVDEQVVFMVGEAQPPEGFGGVLALQPRRRDKALGSHTHRALEDREPVVQSAGRSVVWQALEFALVGGEESSLGSFDDASRRWTASVGLVCKSVQEDLGAPFKGLLKPLDELRVVSEQVSIVVPGYDEECWRSGGDDSPTTERGPGQPDLLLEGWSHVVE